VNTDNHCVRNGQVFRTVVKGKANWRGELTMYKIGKKYPFLTVLVSNYDGLDPQHRKHNFIDKEQSICNGMRIIYRFLFFETFFHKNTKKTQKNWAILKKQISKEKNLFSNQMRGRMRAKKGEIIKVNTSIRIRLNKLGGGIKKLLLVQRD